MRIQSVKVVACGVAALLAGCAGGSGGGGQLDVGTAGRAEKLELLLDDRGNLAEVEYHLMPEAVPEAVRAAMRNLHPGARVFGAEREALKGVTYWELAGVDGGLEVEAMFHDDGRLHEEEIQIPIEQVPPPVREAVRQRWLAAKVTAWEEIRNARREVFEYHVKLTDNRRNYKVSLSPTGEVRSVVREVAAEVEVPVE